MLVFIPHGQDVILLGMEAHRVIPIGPAVSAPRTEDALHQLWVFHDEVIGSNTGEVAWEHSWWLEANFELSSCCPFGAEVSAMTVPQPVFRRRIYNSGVYSPYFLTTS